MEIEEKINFDLKNAESPPNLKIGMVCCVKAAEEPSDLIFVGTSNFSISIYRKSTFNKIYDVRHHHDWVTAIQIVKIKNFTFLLSGGGLSDSLIKIWDFSLFEISHNLNLMMTMRGHQKSITNFVYDKQHQLLYSSGSDCIILVWKFCLVTDPIIKTNFKFKVLLQHKIKDIFSIYSLINSCGNKLFYGLFNGDLVFRNNQNYQQTKDFQTKGPGHSTWCIEYLKFPGQGIEKSQLSSVEEDEGQYDEFDNLEEEQKKGEQEVKKDMQLELHSNKFAQKYQRVLVVSNLKKNYISLFSLINNEVIRHIGLVDVEFAHSFQIFQYSGQLLIACLAFTQKLIVYNVISDQKVYESPKFKVQFLSEWKAWRAFDIQKNLEGQLIIYFSTEQDQSASISLSKLTLSK